MEQLISLVLAEGMLFRNNLSKVIESTGMAVVNRSTSDALLALEWLSSCDFHMIFVPVFLKDTDILNFCETVKKKFANVKIILTITESTKTIDITPLKMFSENIIDLSGINNISSLPNNIILNRMKSIFALFIVQSSNSVSKSEKPVKEPVKSSFASAKAQQEQTFTPSTLCSKPNAKLVNKFDQSLWRKPDLILIASSTGGPSALESLFSNLNPSIKTPILIVQHIPKNYTVSLAQTLDKKCNYHVVEGKNAEQIEEEKAILAPGGFHMIVQKVKNIIEISLNSSELINGVRPSADVLFKTVSELFPKKNILVVVLTGMGSDGCNGLIELKQNCNCFCITQSEKTCVVYGMPGSVDKIGLSDVNLDLDKIPDMIFKMTIGRR